MFVILQVGWIVLVVFCFATACMHAEKQIIGWSYPLAELSQTVKD